MCPSNTIPSSPTELIDVLDPQPGRDLRRLHLRRRRPLPPDRRADRPRGRADRGRSRPGLRGALARVRRRGAPSRARFLRADFVAALEGLRGEGVRPDGIVFDLGMSSMQVDAWERGFSYSYDAPLDMRMDPTQSLSAATVVNEWPQDRLAPAIRELGEERRAGSIAREITKRRPIETTGQLVSAIKAAIPPSERFGRGHPAKRTFQAIRIAVNGELDALDRALPLAWGVLRVGGRLGAISFHSLEDRRVKRYPGRPRPRLRLPAGASRLRLRPRARGRADHQARDRPGHRGARAEPARGLGAPARRPQDPRGGGTDGAACTTAPPRPRAPRPRRRTAPRRKRDPSRPLRPRQARRVSQQWRAPRSSRRRRCAVWAPSATSPTRA